MIEKIAIFILFLGPLVFFHELGHFFFARLFGVRVEVFSIGFGPKLFSFKKGDTQYAFSLIPLGGYVKMFGDDPLSEDKLTPEEEAVAYTKKGKWARFCIVFGGPLANFILAFFIYLSLVTFGENVPQTRFGIVAEKSELYKGGFRSGDILKKINEHEIVSFDDLNLVDSEVSKVTVERLGQVIEIDYKSNGIKFAQDFSRLSPKLIAPIVVDTQGKNYLLSVDKPNVDKMSSVQELVELDLKKINVTLILNQSFEGLNLQNLKFSETNIELSVKNGLVQTLKDNGFYTRDLWVNSIVMNSAASKAGLKRGDILLSLNKTTLNNFEDLKNEISSMNEEKEVSLKVLSDGAVKELFITPKFNEINGEKVLLIGVYPGAIASPIKMVTVKSKGFFEGLTKALTRTIDGTYKTILGFKKLITAEVSIKNIGGPIAIGQVASDSFNVSLSMFFRLMAIISINLGVINLFPIPVLDGGHIVFIILEIINRGPLSRKKLLYAQQVGMSLLFLLIFVALFNDVSRFF